MTVITVLLEVAPRMNAAGFWSMPRSDPREHRQGSRTVGEP